MLHSHAKTILLSSETAMNDQQLEQYSHNGYFIVSKGFSSEEIKEMRLRLEAIVSGKFAKLGRRFQADTESGEYGDVNHADMRYGGPNVAYRKIADLEYDDVFLQKLQSSWIRTICSRLVGDVVSILRVTMMDKPAQGGTPLPWHQDVSLNWPVTSQPALAIWFPLDDATAESGSLQIIPKSHTNGVIGAGHLLPPSLEAQYAPAGAIVDVEMAAGDCLFFHPQLLHRSGLNRTDSPRRAINAILMPGHSIHTNRHAPYPVLIGVGALVPEQVVLLNEIPHST